MIYVKDSESLLRRLEKLEKRYLLTKSILTLCIVLFASLMLMGTRGTDRVVADEVIANRIVILDEKQNPRLVLSSTPEFSGLLIADSSGIKKTTIGVTVAGPSVAVYDTHGRVRGALNCINDMAGYGLYRHSGAPAIALTATDKTAGFYFYDLSMKQLAGLSSNTNGSSKLALYDEKNIMRATISVGESGPILALFDETKRTVFKKP